MSAFSQSPRLYLVVLVALLGGLLSPLESGMRSSRGPADEKPWVAVGRDLLEKGEYEQGIAYFNKQFGAVGTEDRDRTEIYRYLAVFYWYADGKPEAINSCRKALELASSLGLREEMASIEAELALQEDYSRALGLRVQGDLAGSNLNFEKARLKSRSIGNRAYEQKILRSWSSNYLGSPNTMDSYLDLNIQALDLAQSLSYRVEASRAAMNIGVFYSMKSDYSHALSYLLRSLSYVRELSSSKDAVFCLNNIASVYITLGDFDKALDYITDAMKRIGPRNPGPIRSSLLINLGQTFQAMSRDFQDPRYDSQALECFSSYLKLEKTAGGTGFSCHALNGIAGVYLDQGRLDEARALLLPVLDKLKADTTPALTGMTMLNLAGIAFKKGEVMEAEGYYREARAAARRNADVLQLIRAAYGLGRCSERRYDNGQAIAFYHEALGVVASAGSRIANDTNRAEFISRSREPFQALIELYYRLSVKDPSGTFVRELYRVSEGFRVKSLMEYLAKRSQRKGPRPADDAESPIADKLNYERLTLLKELSHGAGSKSGTEELGSRIRHIDDMLDALVFDRQLQDDAAAVLTLPISLDILQNSLLTDRTVLVEYLLGDERSYLICVTKSSFHIVPLPPARAIQDSLTAYLSFLEDPSILGSKGLPAARRLYEDLFLPAEGFIPASVDRLFIVPDGILFRLPFETLVRQGTDPVSAGRYLGDRFVISYAPSASALFYLARKPKVPYAKEVLAFGDPEHPQFRGRSAAEGDYSAALVLDDLYKRSGFLITPIPYARRETADLANRVPPGKADLYSGDRATEGALKRLDLEAYRLIHLACHAFSDDHYPLRSSFVFSAGPGDAEDGFLQVSEMYGMRTNADLVVLSACQTGRGKIVQGEGVLGLPRIFFYMGARSVISTLWPVHDKAGAAFMDYFYEGYFHGAGKAEALQAAKRKMAKTKYSHPYYWASYTLTGEF